MISPEPKVFLSKKYLMKGEASCYIKLSSLPFIQTYNPRTKHSIVTQLENKNFKFYFTASIKLLDLTSARPLIDRSVGSEICKVFFLTLELGVTN